MAMSFRCSSVKPFVLKIRNVLVTIVFSVFKNIAHLLACHVLVLYNLNDTPARSSLSFHNRSAASASVSKGLVKGRALQSTKYLDRTSTVGSATSARAANQTCVVAPWATVFKKTAMVLARVVCTKPALPSLKS